MVRNALPLEPNFYDRPVHGPVGRIAFVRQLLGLRQLDLAEALVKEGARASRETVSHWENLDGEGRPRARMTRRNSAALAALVRKRLGEDIPPGAFYDPRETTLDAVLTELQEVKHELRRLQRRPRSGRSPTATLERTVASWDGTDDELLDAKQAAALLTVQPRTLVEWAKEGRIPCIRLGPRVTRWTLPMLRHIRDRAIDPGRVD